MSEEAVLFIQKEVVATGQALLHKNLVTGTWGNVSARVPESHYIAITPSGSDYRYLSPADISIVDLQGRVITGEKKPSSELLLHLAIYQARPDVGAVVHTHSVFASACAVAHKPIPPIIEDLVQLVGGSVDVAEYSLPGTRELAANAVKALQNKQAILMANHGMAGCGRSLNEALTACELVEKAAQILIYAQQLGGAQVLGPADVAVMHGFYRQHYGGEIHTQTVRGTNDGKNID
ncbi:MAG TPA: class II aldolase/adducin family protein [Patescibacteria group bacterium]|nr:class II aldolase/adducin family protein [Patescibacteria group bacterium]